MIGIIPLNILFTRNLDFKSDNGDDVEDGNYRNDSDYHDDVDESNDGNEGISDGGDYRHYCESAF